MQGSAVRMLAAGRRTWGARAATEPAPTLRMGAAAGYLVAPGYEIVHLVIDIVFRELTDTGTHHDGDGRGRRRRG